MISVVLAGHLGGEAERYGKRGAVNCGIGGDSTRQLLWRISHGEVDV